MVARDTPKKHGSPFRMPMKNDLRSGKLPKLYLRNLAKIEEKAPGKSTISPPIPAQKRTSLLTPLNTHFEISKLHDFPAFFLALQGDNFSTIFIRVNDLI